MSMPFYVAPEQQMKDRADFARKAPAGPIGRGAALRRRHPVRGGEPFPGAAQSQRNLRRIAFAAVGRYNEFENLRTAGIRYADLRGYSYDRTDVTGRGLANAYAQLLGTIFSSGGEKPYEVEIIVAELGALPELDQIYRLTYDGSVADEDNFAVMGGSAEAIADVLGKGFERGRAGRGDKTGRAGAGLRRRQRPVENAGRGRAGSGDPGPDPRCPGSSAASRTPRRAADRGHRALRSGSRPTAHAATGTGCHRDRATADVGCRPESS